MGPEPGDRAPDFAGPDNDSEMVSLEDLRGRWVVLYFYPRDNTSGCTREACGFRDLHGRFESLNAVIVGCSGDSARSHEKFAAKFGLPFILLSDEDHQIATAYGVWQEKKLYGRTSMGIVRTTFLIDPQGLVTHVWRKVKVDGHVEQVLEQLQELAAK